LSNIYIQVQLLQGFQEPLLYSVPTDWSQMPEVGSFVLVPIRKKEVSALVLARYEQQPQTNFAIRPAQRLEPFPHDVLWRTFIARLAQYYQINPMLLIKRVRLFVQQKEQTAEYVAPHLYEPRKHAAVLTHEQQKAADYIMQAVDTKVFDPIVLHGVTGSGKTEVYIAAIKHAFAQNKAVMLLLPEVTLSVQFFHVLRAGLPQEIPLYTFHSGTSVKEKRALWHALLEGKSIVLVGVHLPVMLPIENLGLIIVDEEHEQGYQEKKHPKINTKEAAILRASMLKIPILLGSATPSIATLYNVEHKGWKLFELTKRFAGSFPKITVVSLADKKKRKQFWISTALEAALKDRLARSEQSILFINRRGYSFFIQCKLCGWIPMCNYCSVSLTVHASGAIICHYCGYHTHEPQACGGCGVDKKELLKKGIGTQQVVAILEKMFPHARVGRADMDVTVDRKRWQETIDNFSSGKLDILVGTQTITKGYHFPNVSLVGIVWADLNLHIPVYHATETTLQQLIQVAGRAGRQKEGSEVIVQTMIDHPCYEFIDELKYRQFYKQEIAMRQLVGYPPALRLAQIELKGADEKLVAREAQTLAALIAQRIETEKLAVKLLGPVEPPVAKIQSIFTMRIYLKSASIGTLAALYARLDHAKYKSTLQYTPNPL
jgi:primosomal protein N' (replication factor Y)